MQAGTARQARAEAGHGGTQARRGEASARLGLGAGLAAAPRRIRVVFYSSDKPGDK